MKTSAELEQELAEAKRVEQAAQRVAEAEAKARDQQVKEARKVAAGEVEAVEELVAAVLAEADPSVRPMPGVRDVARRFLLGVIQPPELMQPVDVVAQADQSVAEYLAAAKSASQLLNRLVDPTGDILLPPNDPLCIRCDDAECASWRALIARARALAAMD